GMAEILRDHGLADAGRALEQDVFATLDELELEEAVDEAAIDFLGMAPVEAVEGLERAEAREPRAAGEIDRIAAALLEVDELLDGLGGPEAALVGVGQERGERVASGTEAEAA